MAVWGLRLGAYIGWRNLGKGEDARYTALRRRIPEDQFDRWSLRHVFLFQGLMMWLVAMPLQVSANVRTAAIFWPGVAVWALGIAFEAVREIRTPHHVPAPWTLAVLVSVMIIKWVLSRRVAAVSADR